MRRETQSLISYCLLGGGEWLEWRQPKKLKWRSCAISDMRLTSRRRAKASVLSTNIPSGAATIVARQPLTLAAMSGKLLALVIGPK